MNVHFEQIDPFVMIGLMLIAGGIWLGRALLRGGPVDISIYPAR